MKKRIDSKYFLHYLEKVGGKMFQLQRERQGRSVSVSALRNQRIFFSWNQLEVHDFFFGGKILQCIDEFAHSVAKKHADCECKEVCIDHIRFFSSVRKEDILSCFISVNRVWHSYLEVGVKVVAEDFRLLEQKKILSAYFLFQAIDEKGTEKPIPPVIPESKAEKKRYLAAEKRRKLRQINIFSD